MNLKIYGLNCLCFVPRFCILSVILAAADNVFYLVVGCVGAVVLVIGLLLLVYYRSVKKAVPSDVEPDQHWLP